MLLVEIKNTSYRRLLLLIISLSDEKQKQLGPMRILHYKKYNAKRFFSKQIYYHTGATSEVFVRHVGVTDCRKSESRL
jgi:hypothetical protein